MARIVAEASIRRSLLRVVVQSCYETESMNCYRRPPNRRSSFRSGQYSRAAIAKATSKPISPVYLAIGPVNQTCSIDGTINATESRPAARAGMPCVELLACEVMQRKSGAQMATPDACSRQHACTMSHRLCGRPGARQVQCRSRLMTSMRSLWRPRSACYRGLRCK